MRVITKVTLPVERRRSVANARAFLRRLLDPRETPRVPKDIRREAYYCLKHFPSDLDMQRAEINFLDVFGEPKDT